MCMYLKNAIEKYQIWFDIVVFFNGDDCLLAAWHIDGTIYS